MAEKVTDLDQLEVAIRQCAGIVSSATQESIQDLDSRKVDKEAGKGLSTNDYTTAEKNKLAGIAANATANTGTITGIKMNGASKGTSGVVDLGTVLTAHQDISGKQDKLAKKGAANKGVYVSAAGVVSEMTYEVNATVPAGAKFTDTNTTYTLTQDTTDKHKFTFAGSDGSSVTITIPDNNTTYTLSSLGIGNVKNYDQSKAVKSITRSGTTFTYTCLDGTTGTFTQQDNNTWTAMVGATASAAGTAGYVPAPPKDGYNTKYLRADGTWQVPPDTNTTYSSKAAASGGTDVSLVTTGEKYNWNAKTANTGTVTKVSTGVGLTGGDVTTTGTIKAKLKTETAHTLDSAAQTNTASRQYAVGVDKSGYLSVNVPWTDTHTITGVKGNAESSYRTGNVNLTPANIGAVPTTRTVNGKALSADITLSASDVGAATPDDVKNEAAGTLAALGAATAHTANLDDAGNAHGAYYTDNEAWTKVLTIAGASALEVTVVYQTESVSYDYGCVWTGSHEDYTAQNNSGTSFTGKLGGKLTSTPGPEYTKVYRVAGDTVTAAWRSDSSNHNYYGFFVSVRAFPLIAQDATSIAEATTTVSGFMSAADKSKLDGIAAGAQVNSITGVKGNAESSYRTGNVNLTAANIGLGNVNNTSDANKPISTATQAELNNLSNAKLSHTTISSVTDLNTLKTTGVYHIAVAGCTNTPTSRWGTIFVDFTVGTPYQIYILDEINDVYKRNYKSNAWTAWTLMSVPTTGGDLTGSLTFQNTTDYFAFQKFRTVNGVNHGIDAGVGANGAAAIEHNTNGGSYDGRIELRSDGNLYNLTGDFISKNGTKLSEEVAALKAVTLADLASASTVLEHHRMAFGGRSLGTSVTSAQKTAIQNGTFTGMLVGDYWVINGVTWRIADVNYWYACGDTPFNTNHLVIVPDNIANISPNTFKMNDTDTTAGGYTGSKMYKETLPYFKTICEAAFPGMILTHREYLVNAVTNGVPSAAGWRDSSVELMSEIMLYGSRVVSPGNDGTKPAALPTINKQQLALFSLHPGRIGGATYWLRDPVSDTQFARQCSGGSIWYNGLADYGVATFYCRVRPVFPIG